jgi:trk system potassium uptake protein TrkA
MSSFGSYLARALAQEGVDVMAIDLDDEKIERIKHSVSKAVIADATDRPTLANLGLDHMDGVVVSLGQIESSVLTTLHLKELNIKRIVAKALSEEHGIILELVGATEVIFPEKDMAIKVSRTLTHENIMDHVPLAEGYSIVEIAPPESFVKKSIGELDLRRKYEVQVIVIKHKVPEPVVHVPTANYLIKKDDILVMMGRDEDLKKVQSL